MTIQITKYQQDRWLNVIANQVTQAQFLNDTTPVGTFTPCLLVRRGLVLVNDRVLTPPGAYTKVGFYLASGELAAAVLASGNPVPAGQLVVSLGA